MANENSMSDQNWNREQINKFTAIRPRYKKLENTLKTILKRLIDPQVESLIIESRTKNISSFAEKIQRKKAKYSDPVVQFTDLTGVRIIVFTKDQVDRVKRIIEDNFQVDKTNTLDTAKRLGPHEFGYCSIHYIVQFKPEIRDLFKDINIPNDVFPDSENPMKAEIQLKTILEHAWAHFAHDREYKASFDIPDKWKHQLAGLSAILENAGKSFLEIQNGLKIYASSFGEYMSKEKILERLHSLEIILEFEPDNSQIAHRIAKFAMAIEDWERAYNVLEPFENNANWEILRDMGWSLYQINYDNPQSESYKRGQELIRQASNDDNCDSYTMAIYASTWKRINENKTRELFLKAYKKNAIDPYTLVNYLAYEICHRKDPSLVETLTPVIEKAIKVCRERIEVGVNFPWPFFNLGQFYLMTGEPLESLKFFAKAIEVSPSDWMIKTTSSCLDKLGSIKDKLPGYEWCRRLLMIGRETRFGGTPRTKKEISSFSTDELIFEKEPIIILAGLSSEDIDTETSETLLKAFRDFQGTIISGGTSIGISKLASIIARENPNCEIIGYLPGDLPENVEIAQDYAIIVETESDYFSPMEPIQVWTDIISMGIDPKNVRLIGIGGGKISALEYRIALALGSKVGIIDKSGDEAALILKDPLWANSNNLLCLPREAFTIRAFLGNSPNRFLDEEKRDQVAAAAHKEYRNKRRREILENDKAMTDWANLKQDLSDSNYQQADSYISVLDYIGCSIHEVKNRPVSIMTFTDKEIELMAQLEHARWNIERLLKGWKHGPQKDVDKKISPYLIPWNELTEEIKDYDRNAMRKIPEILALVNLEVRRSD